MLHIDIICIGKLKELYLKDAVYEYSKRLSKYCSLSIIELNDISLPNKLNDKIANDIKQKECDLIRAKIKKDSYVICLDLHGRQYSSEDFALHIDKLSLKTSHITFIIGGSLGMTSNFLSSSNELICFSKMTFPHQLIRVFLLEQIFRCFKIINGESYHK